MAITLKAHVSFPLTVVVHTETMQMVAAARAACKVLTETERAEKFKEADKEERSKLDLFLSEKTDEQVIEQIYRAALRRHIRKELRSELTNDESTARIGDTLVVFGRKEVTE